VNEPVEREPAPPHVLELMAMCVRAVQKATQIVLDATPDTLPVLDHYLTMVPREGDAIRDLVAPAAGAYFGELVRSLYPCRWHAPADDFGAWRIEFENVFLHFNPVALAHEAVMRQEVVRGGAGFNVLDQDVDTVRAGLAALGTIAEEDYFKLSTRLEALQTVVDRLIGQSQKGGDAAVMRFGPEVYRAALDDDGASAS
jgi:hypothetical protein